MVAKRDQRYSRQPPRALLGFFGRETNERMTYYYRRRM